MSALEPSASEVFTPAPSVENLTNALRGTQQASENKIASVVRILHDDLGGLLVSAIMDLSWIGQHLGADSVPIALERAQNALAAAIDLNRDLTESLHPSILENFGLTAAFRWHLSRACEPTSTSCTYTLPDHEPRLSPEASIALFRIGEETLSAVLAEPGVEKVHFSMVVEEENLILQITHEHSEAERVAALHASTNLYATIQRVEGLRGTWSIRCSSTGSAMRAEFPCSALTSAEAQDESARGSSPGS
jgi:two-component system, NarL family, sensor kinase